MTQQEYEQKRHDSWIRFKTETMFTIDEYAFYAAFDRAYALGKQTDAISQEEIDKAAEGYADKNFIESIVVEEPWPSAKFAFAQAFKDGANYALGKQEKDADTVIQGWVARDQDGYISLFKDKPIRDMCDKDDIPYGFWDEANSNHLELPITSFPDLTWESESEPVDIIIKRKKK